MAAPDLTRAVTFRSTALNTIVDSLISDQNVIVGCQLDSFDLSDIELRQFTEPLALADGIDVGGVWKGARKLSMRGTVYDSTRGKTYDRIDALEAIMLPDSGTFGYFNLTFYTITNSGAVLKTLQARPNGLRYNIEKSRHGGADADALAIQWAVSMYCKDPSVT